MSLAVVLPAACDPVTLAEAKLHLRIDAGDTSQDAFIAECIAGATLHVQGITARQFVQATLRYGLDELPMPQPLEVQRDRSNYRVVQFPAVINLPRSPLVSVTSVQYLDPAGALQTLDPSLYVVEGDTEPARLAPALGAVWPSVANLPGAVRVTFVAGYSPDASDLSAIPAHAKILIKFFVAQWFDARGPGDKENVPSSIEALIWSLRVPQA
jgi:uncharacterized phiE125 gp8 family phage protein